MRDLLKDKKRFIGTGANKSARVNDPLRHNAVKRGGYPKIPFHFLDRTKHSFGCRLCIATSLDARLLRLDIPPLGFDSRPLRFDRPEPDLQFVPRYGAWCL